MIIRLSFIVAASIAALKILESKRNRAIKTQASKKSNSSHLEHEFEEMENSTANANKVIQNDEKKQNKTEWAQIEGEFEDCKVLTGCEKMDYITEKELLQNLIQNYKLREISLERKLIELNRLKEEKSIISQLKMQLEKKRAKLESLEETISFLQFESKILKEKIEEDIMCKMQLEIANKGINEMEMKKKIKGSHVKDQTLMLQQQVDEFHKFNGVKLNKKHEHVEDTQLEVLEMKRRNKKLELEKREVGVKLVNAQTRIITEETKMAQIQEEITDLKQVQEELSEQVEILQRNRFDMVHELVYQRWLFTCLRFEVNNHKKQIRNCNHISGKAFISDSEHDTLSSNATLHDFDEIETTTFESSSSSQSSSSKNYSFLSKMKRWKKTKDNKTKISQKGGNRRSLMRRFSMSMVESELSKPRISCCGGDDSLVKNLEKPMTRLKRVSFSDLVQKSTYQVMQEEVEDVIDENETNYELTSTITCLELEEHKEEEQYDEKRKSDEYVVCNNEKIAENEGGNSNNQTDYPGELCSKNDIMCRKCDRIKSIRVQLLVFFFLLINLLAYFKMK